MRIEVRGLALVAGGLLAAGLAGPALADDGSAAVLQKLQQRYPATKFSDLRPTPVPGVFAVRLGQTPVHVDSTGRYFFFGTLFDLVEQRDLAVAPAPTSAPLDWNRLPLGDALVFKQGTGRRRLAVFSDPQCPACRRFEAELAALEDTTVYVFPLGFSPTSADLAAALWCQSDASEQWRRWLQRSGGGTALPAPAPDCAGRAVIDRNLQLAETLGVTATPTLIDARGRRHVGGLPATSLSAWLDATTASGE